MRFILRLALILFAFTTASSGRGAEIRLIWKQSYDSPEVRRDFAENAANLKEGDTVHFSDQKFKLGPFLGKGNSTYIFALDEKRAIRIPMRAEDVDFICMTIRGSSVLKASVVQAVQVFWEESSRDCEYAVVERVNALFTLADWFHIQNNATGLVSAEARKNIEAADTKIIDQEIERFFLNTYEFAYLDRDFAPRQIAWTGERFVLLDWTQDFVRVTSTRDMRTVIDDAKIERNFPYSKARELAEKILNRRANTHCSQYLTNPNDTNDHVIELNMIQGLFN